MKASDSNETLVLRVTDLQMTQSSPENQTRIEFRAEQDDAARLIEIAETGSPIRKLRLVTDLWEAINIRNPEMLPSRTYKEPGWILILAPSASVERDFFAPGHRIRQTEQGTSIADVVAVLDKLRPQSPETVEKILQQLGFELTREALAQERGTTRSTRHGKELPCEPG